MSEEEALARRRFAALSLVRLGGAACLTVGLLAVGGKIVVPQVLGIGLVLLGLAGFLVIPRSLSRKWKSGQQ
ncbi:hypothetical protein ACQKOE_08120 [Novosphingobium sp. NPDC080210]|uniref:hypothetical protein n=1 Tax=unclassified Novosphingobium TaxID=2644732 RepID=UPI0035B406EF